MNIVHVKSRQEAIQRHQASRPGTAWVDFLEPGRRAYKALRTNLAEDQFLTMLYIADPDMFWEQWKSLLTVIDESATLFVVNHPHHEPNL